MINIFGIPIGGVEIFKINLLMKGFVFSLLLVLALHYGIIYLVRAFEDFRAGQFVKGTSRIIFIAIITAGFVYVSKLNFMYTVLAYIFLSIYLILILSRGFFAWYVRTDEISRKLDRILRILESEKK